MAMHFNTEPIKYALIALSAPIWLPFTKALLKEFNDALRDEGGLLGRQPTARELEKMNKVYGKFESPMHSERWDEVERGERARHRRPNMGGASSAKRPRGFRSSS